MALLVYYSLVQDGSREIEYRFGGTEAMDQRLTIDKATKHFEDQDGASHGMVASTAARIMGRHRTEGEWPEKGMIQA
jgi:hypothetical protein